MQQVFSDGLRGIAVATLCLAFMSVEMTCNIAEARLKPTFGYKKLFKESDVVVIATVVKTDDTDDKFPGHEREFKGQDTEFEIQKVIQGDVDGERLKLLHFKYVGTPPANGPMLVKFEPGLETEGFMMAQAEYMLFLKRTDDGRYVPVSGQYDSEDSVKILSPPGINRPKAKQDKQKKK